MSPANEDQWRADVCAEALSWLGTPFVDQGDVKGAGVDCAMLLVRVYTDVGLLPPFDPRPYPPQWMLHQSEERFLGWVRQFGIEVGQDEYKPGNAIVYQFGRCFAHGAIILNKDEVIHAWFDRRKVATSQTFDIKLTHIGRTNTPRPYKIFDIWGARDGRRRQI